MKVRISPAEPAPEDSKQAKIIRAAAYCRVSTDTAEQETSYKAQIDYYTDYIRRQPCWENAGIFAGEGLTGTRAEARPEFMKMIALCEQGFIDLVITKSISRFARNTLDCLTYIRKLRDLGIPIIFEKENINTIGEGGELLLTIMASLAQQESLSISQNVRMGIRYRFRKGKPMLNHSFFLGYTKEKGDSRLTIVPEEAEIVRRIFRDFLDGFTYKEIAQHLEVSGIPSPAGKEHWYESTVKSMLQNEKYTGDLLLQKTYTASILSGKRIKNDGELPQYYVKDAHDAIIPREIFELTQEELKSRSSPGDKNTKIRIAGNPSLNHKLFCSLCGARYRRYYNGGVNPVWRCETRIRDRHACPAPAVPEQDLRRAVQEALLSLPDLLDSKLTKAPPGKKKFSIIQYHQRTLLLLAEALAKQRAVADCRPPGIREPDKTVCLPVKNGTDKLPSPSCTETEDFLLRTTPDFSADPSAVCNDETVRRFLESICISETAYQVRFKGGMTITIPAEKL